MKSLGLISYANNDDINQMQEAEALERESRLRRQVIESSIVGQIRRDWEAAKQAKRPHEQVMLDCLRRKKGEYSQDKLTEIRATGGSEIYMGITATKSRALASWIRDVLLPSNGEIPFGLDPTEIAEIPKPIENALYQQVQANAQSAIANGESVNPLEMLESAKEELKLEAMRAAKKAAERHEELIKDQLEEGGWTEAIEQFIDDFSTFPAAIIKGPILKSQAVLAWGEGWRPIKEAEIIPWFKRVSPFDLYPSGDATTPDDGAYLFERERFRPADLSAMKGIEGYNDKAIDRALQQYSQNGLQDWLWTDSERADLEGKEHSWLSSRSTIDGLIYHGYSMGLSLLQAGMVNVEPLKQYPIEAILVGNELIRLVINDDPLEKRPYNMASFQSIPGAFWGQSIPQLMADIQDMCNATARSLANNMGLASGPMVEMNYDRLAPEEDGTVYPWKVFQTKSASNTGNNPAIRFYQPNSLANELLGVYTQFEQRADEVTNVPRYMYGSEKVGGAGATMGGLSMLMESANKGIKAAIGYIDKGVIRRSVHSLWLYNMLYSPDSSIKGDCNVVPRGSSAMLLRDRTNVLRNEFLAATNNPTDMEIIGIEGRVKLLSTIAKHLDIPGLLDNPKEVIDGINQQRAAQAQSGHEAQQLQNQLLKGKVADLQAKIARTMADIKSKPLEDRKLAAEIQKLLVEVEGGIIDAPEWRSSPAAMESSQRSEQQRTAERTTQKPPSQFGLEVTRGGVGGLDPHAARRG